ncbi:2OG-Fe(II) oxygenase [Xylariales sp. PMI_506]|nr:2OG-Fe(II) oxygenase [Xylariales sp. PMI_506]
MAAAALQLPLIDLSGYLAPKSPEDRDRVIAQVRDACSEFGFFQLKGHGVTLQQQQGLFRGMHNFFNLPAEDKLKYSFLENPCRRGYEASGQSLRDTDVIADSKEAFYIGQENPVIEHLGFYGPNNWPELPDEKFKGPVWDYYEATSQLGRTIWEILLQGLGHSAETLNSFAQKPVVPLKLLRYPRISKTLPDQFGAGSHTDFGGVTVLIQQPGKEGLEVWLQDREEWLSVPALEDVFVINCGDMIQRWSGGKYKSVLHRVINKSDAERLSCALFWHGNIMATNPLNPDDPDKTTVGQLWMNRFKNQMSIPKEAIKAFSST